MNEAELKARSCMSCLLRFLMVLTSVLARSFSSLQLTLLHQVASILALYQGLSNIIITSLGKLLILRRGARARPALV